MNDYMGQINAFAFNYAPLYWAQCNGQLLNINLYTPLYSLLSDVYGGDGKTTFALPDLRGRSVVHAGEGTGLEEIYWGEEGGNETAKISLVNFPMHVHSSAFSAQTTISVNEGIAINNPDNGINTFGFGGLYDNIYSEPAHGTENTVGGVITTINGSLAPVGNSTPLAFPIRSPYLALNVCICIEGVYPPRNDN